MNAFESIVAGLFRADGYWTTASYRVELTKDEKRKTGRPSLARPEIDILAYKGSTNELVWVECKSYLDSKGVRYASFTKQGDQGYKSYKVFNDSGYREVISRALITQAIKTGLTRPRPILNYCLVAGKVGSDADRKKLQSLFLKKGGYFVTWIGFDKN